MANRRSLRRGSLVVALLVTAGCTATTTGSKSNASEVGARTPLLGFSEGPDGSGPPAESNLAFAPLQRNEPVELLDPASVLINQRLSALGAKDQKVEVADGTIKVSVKGPHDVFFAVMGVSETGRVEIRPVLANLGRSPQEATQESLEITTSRIRQSFGIAPTMSLIDAYNDATNNVDSPLHNESDIKALSRASSMVSFQRSDYGPWITTPVPLPDQETQLTSPDGTLYRLGPARLTNEAVGAARASLGKDRNWRVELEFRPGPQGTDAFNTLLANCASGAPECPPGNMDPAVAVLLDDRILSVTPINSGSIEGDRITVPFQHDRTSAEVIAAVVNSGPLPLELIWALT